MRHPILVAAIVLIVLAGPPLAGAAVLEVPSGHATIQEAIDASSDGDTVIVSPGLYYERINFNGKNIVLTSTDPNDARIVGYTVINAGGEGSVVTFENDETSEAVLTGFTITGGTGTLMDSTSDWYKSYYGGGIYCRRGRPTITRNVITNNIVPYSRELVDEVIDGIMYRGYRYEWSDGGGIFCSSGAIITHNIIYNNSAEVGGGIRCGYSTVTNNIIYDNSAVSGGGVYIYAGVLLNNTIVGNDANLEPESGRGGNVYANFPYDYTRLTIASNIIANADSGAGLYWTNAGGEAIRFNNVWGNHPADYAQQDPRTYEMIVGEAADWTGRNGNISVDPVFSTLWSERWHLDTESPCISAGDPNLVPMPGETDIDGDPRVFAKRVDIGADERIGYVKPLADAGDDHHILSPAPVTLDGGESYFSDPEGMTQFQWTQTQGSAVDFDDSAATAPTFTAPSEGWYVFELVVSDANYTSDPDRVLVVVGNERPVARAGTDSLWPSPGFVMLDGSQSSDADPPDELKYTWTQVDGPSIELVDANSATPYFETEEAGIYQFELLVADGFADSEPDVVKIEAGPFVAEVEPFEVTTRDDGDFYWPDLAGTGVVASWEGEDYRNWQIHWEDLKTGESVTFDAGAVEAKPKIEGDLIVWAAGSGYYFQPILTGIYLGDLLTGEEVTLERGRGDVSCGYPAISGNKVVWLRHRNVDTGDEEGYNRRPYDIRGADVSDVANPVYFTVAEDAGHGVPYPYDNYYRSHEGFIDISGDIVVWEADGDIYGADISDLDNIRVFPVCTAPERQFDPAVSGHLVVWTDERNDIGDIYGADISDANNVREFAVWARPGWQLQADIDGPIIVFSNGDDYSGTIEARCVTREYGLVDIPIPGWRYGAGPQIDGTTITWAYSYQIQGIHLDFGYGLVNGPVENLTSGSRHDYIQHAISSAADGDVIVVSEGTYAEQVRFGGKKVTVTSTDPEDPAVRAATVITGGGQLVGFDTDETADCLFTGFTVTGGSFGIFCNGSSPTITHCDVTGNRDAGIKLWGNSKPTIERCAITANARGLEMWADARARRIVLSEPTLRNCVIAGNREYGMLGSDPTVENCTIADNLWHGLSCSSPVVKNSIIYFNNGGGENVAAKKKLTATYSNIQGGWSGEGNIDADPLFVACGSWTDTGQWLPGDYHLKSQGWSWDMAQGAWAWDDATSPCIDAGDPTLPLGEEMACEAGGPLGERASNARLNMGAYGGTAEASLAPRP